MSYTKLQADSINIKSWNPIYKTLDHWRGLAALWVVIFHGFVSTLDISLHPSAEFVKSIAAHGRLGVNLFFVISGYCIAVSAYRSVSKNGSPWTFIKNRAWRLLPTYWLAFLLTIGLNFISAFLNKRSIWENIPNTWQDWVGNLFLIQPYLEVPFYVIVYWSLVVEFAFYLIVTLLLFLKSLTNYRIPLFIGLSLGFVSVFMIEGSKIAPLTYWCDFVCGVLVFAALLFKSQGKLYQVRTCLFLLLNFIFLSIWVNWGFHSSYLWFSAAFALLLYYIYPLDSKIAAISQLDFLRITGLMSYSLYLLHVPFQARIITLGSKFISEKSFLFLLLQICGWIVCLLISYIFYKLIENPINQWRKRQIKKKTMTT
ncbi:MAG: acyltransferase [Cyanobacteria bacterium P01_A01_bin.84]